VTRAFLYVRVSKEREDGVSPEIQESEARAYCERKGWVIIEVFRDLDLSASRLPPERRPALQEMLRRAEDGECDVVVFYAIDRLARRMEDHYAIIASLRESGVTVDAVGTPYQDTPEGAFMWDLTAALAALEARRLGKRIRDSHKTLRAKGRYPGGHPPYGMRRVVPGPGLEPDPVEAPWLIRMHEWYQQGWSCPRIARELNALGAPTRRGGKWLGSVVSRVLRQPMTAGGRLLDGVLVTGGNIRPVIDEETWRRSQARATGDASRFRAGKTSRGPIPTRITRCGSCGRTLRVHYRTGDSVQLRCYAQADGACPYAVTIYAHVLERLLQQAIIAKLRRMKATPPQSKSVNADMAAIDREVEAAKAGLERLALAYADGAMGREEYQGARQKLLERLERARARQERQSTQAQNAALLEGIRALWGDLEMIGRHPELLTELPEAERRDLYQLLVERVTVFPVSRKPRIQVQFRW